MGWRWGLLTFRSVPADGSVKKLPGIQRVHWKCAPGRGAGETSSPGLSLTCPSLFLFLFSTFLLFSSPTHTDRLKRTQRDKYKRGQYHEGRIWMTFTGSQKQRDACCIAWGPEFDPWDPYVELEVGN